MKLVKKHLIFLLLLVIVKLSLPIINENKIYECEYYDFVDSYNLGIEFEQGSGHISYQSIDQSLQFTWMKVSYLLTLLPKKYIIGEKHIMIDSHIRNGTEYQHSVTIARDYQKSFEYRFYYVNGTRERIDSNGGIALPFKFEDKEYSMVYQLKKQGYIDRLSYAIIPSISLNGMMYFGGIPLKETHGLLSGSCQVDNKYSTWGCRLSHVFFGSFYKNATIESYHNRTFENPHYAYFQVGIKGILVPSDFIQFMHYVIFEDYIKRKQCYIEKSDLICENIAVNLVPDCNFVFEERIILKFEWINYFECGNRVCRSLLKKNHAGNNWVFGIDFISKFIMLFNYDSESITFFSKKDIGFISHHKVANNSIVLIKVLYIIIIVGLLQFIILFLILKNKVLSY